MLVTMYLLQLKESSHWHLITSACQQCMIKQKSNNQSRYLDSVKANVIRLRLAFLIYSIWNFNNEVLWLPITQKEVLP